MAWCLEAFASATRVDRAIVAAPADQGGRIEELAPDDLELEVVVGGATRSQSVASALAAARAELVVIHDAARPLVTAELVDRLVEVLLGSDAAAGVIAARPLTDTVKRAAPGERRIAATEPRERLWSAQTPQVFRAAALRDAYAAAGVAAREATDDAMLVERAGGQVLVEPGPADNIKVTTPDDLRLARLLLQSRAG